MKSLQQSPAHSLEFLTGDDGIAVPVTSIQLDDSPDGTANAPFQAYRTVGPGSEPEHGLPDLRAGWIRSRGDVEEYEGRQRDLLDDGRSAARRGAASEE